MWWMLDIGYWKLDGLKSQMFNLDKLVKSQLFRLTVIPAKAGIQ